jgi:DNA modification methylase
MFSMKGDTVLDPFLGSGTTIKSAIQNARNSVGYESDESLLPLIKQKINLGARAAKLIFVKRKVNSSKKKPA